MEMKSKEEIRDLVAEMLPEEKAALCSGADDWNTVATGWELRHAESATALTDCGCRRRIRRRFRTTTICRQSAFRRNVSPQPALTGNCCGRSERLWEKSARPEAFRYCWDQG